MKSNSGVRYGNLREFLYRNPAVKKFEVAEKLGVHASQLTKLLNPEKYQPRVGAELAKRIASLLNQPITKVIEMYARYARAA